MLSLSVTLQTIKITLPIINWRFQLQVFHLQNNYHFHVSLKLIKFIKALSLNPIQHRVWIPHNLHFSRVTLIPSFALATKMHWRVGISSHQLRKLFCRLCKFCGESTTFWCLCWIQFIQVLKCWSRYVAKYILVFFNK